MSDKLTKIELKAKQATDNNVFNKISILAIREEIEILLSRVGSNTFFKEYTDHSFKHVKHMCNSVDWIIPSKTDKILTKADALLITLSIYFHDLGLVVLDDEFDMRDKSSFPSFKADVFSDNNQYSSYAQQVRTLSDDESEAFLYQEFVRKHHAERVASWITGKYSISLGCADFLASEVGKLCSDMPLAFKRDLANVCRSHHEDIEVDDTKFPIARHYGSDEDDAANVFYSTIVLRTADILHLQSDRTPPIMFRIINPSNPLSQREWAKHMGVDHVGSKFGLDLDGNVSESAERSEIKVHAYYNNSDAFFALSSFLKYVESELKKSFLATRVSNQKFGAKHEFPWRKIDRAHIETEGFLPEKLNFELDEDSILKLLTGHTLYNDSGVVVRELMQNAIDAVRLTKPTRKDDSNIRIINEPENGIFTIVDRGSGMTQEVIQDYFLKVGSSYYQSEGFRDQHPDFVSISRFGIGILTCFLVSDEIDVLTVHPDELEARQLSIRNLQGGQYLTRLISKDDDLVKAIGTNGTSIRIKLRSGSDQMNIRALLKSWITFPNMKVDLEETDKEVERIGMPDSGSFIKRCEDHFNHILNSQTHGNERGGILGAIDPEHRSRFQHFQHKREFKLSKVDSDILDFYILTEWNRYLSTYEPVILKGNKRKIFGDEFEPGVFIQGIRVTNQTYGFNTEQMPVIYANASGVDAPRTNVARTELETDHKKIEKFEEAYYACVAGWVSKNCSDLTDKYGLSWASQEVGITLRQLESSAPKNVIPLSNALASIPSVLIETENGRELITLNDAQNLEKIATISAPIMRYSEFFFREITSIDGIRNLIDEPLGVLEQIDSVPLMCQSPFGSSHVKLTSDPSDIWIFEDERRIDVVWKKRSGIEKKNAFLQKYSANLLFLEQEVAQGTYIGPPNSFHLASSGSFRTKYEKNVIYVPRDNQFLLHEDSSIINFLINVSAPLDHFDPKEVDLNEEQVVSMIQLWAFWLNAENRLRRDEQVIATNDYKIHLEARIHPKYRDIVVSDDVLDKIQIAGNELNKLQLIDVMQFRRDGKAN